MSVDIQIDDGAGVAALVGAGQAFAGTVERVHRLVEAARQALPAVAAYSH